MRIWDLPVEILCAKHLLGEHRELHAMWSVITNGKKGYSKHPETLRWHGKLVAMFKRHEAQVAEMRRRGWNHKSPLDKTRAVGSATQDKYVDAPNKQRDLLKMKGCKCAV